MLDGSPEPFTSRDEPRDGCVENDRDNHDLKGKEVGETISKFAQARSHHVKLRRLSDRFQTTHRSVVKVKWRYGVELRHAKHHKEEGDFKHGNPTDHDRRLPVVELRRLERVFADSKTNKHGNHISSFQCDRANGSESQEGNGGSDSGASEDHGRPRSEPHGADRKLGARIGVVEKLGQASITSKREEHARRGDGGAESAANTRGDDDCHQDTRPSLAGCIVDELDNGLRVAGGENRVDVLNREEHAQEEDEAGDSRNADRHDDTLGSVGMRVLRFLGKMGRRIVAEVGPGGHEETEEHSKAHVVPASVVDKVGENKVGRSEGKQRMIIRATPPPSRPLKLTDESAPPQANKQK